ncbi:MAG: hypothetical protein Q4G00_15530 [Clostridia bacterium]|nr:hypothetical protein [Clostridia bacterium]
MKTRFWLFLALAVLLSFLLTPPSFATSDGAGDPAGGSDASAGCDVWGHNWTDWQTAQEPTCTESGSLVRFCTRCWEQESSLMPALGHTFEDDWIPIQQPGCVEEGIEARYCHRCQAQETRPIPATGHVWSDWVNYILPTCTDSGLEAVFCLNCKEQVTRESDPLGHDYQDDWTVIQPATCTEEGMEARYCHRCQEQETRSIPVIDHEWSEWTPYIFPTCTESGWEASYCLNCKEQATREVEALGHDFRDDWTVIDPASCTEDGMEARYCHRCQEQETRSIPALGGHTWSDWTVNNPPTCTEEGDESRFCTVCKMEEFRETAPLGHDFQDDWEELQPASCSAEGIEARYCHRCKAEQSRRIPATGHIFSAWHAATRPSAASENLEERTCIKCGYAETRAASGKEEEVPDPTVTSAPSDEPEADEETAFLPGPGVRGSGVIDLPLRPAAQLLPDNTDESAETSGSESVIPYTEIITLEGPVRVVLLETPYCYCERTDGYAGTVSCTWHYCTLQSVAAAAIEEAAAAPQGSRLGLWLRAKRLCMDQLDKQWMQLQKAAHGDAVKAVLQEKEAFYAQLSALDEALKLRYPGSPETAEELTVRTLMRRAVNLCYEMGAEPGETRPDSVFSDHFAKEPNTLPAHCSTLWTDESQESRLNEITCAAHEELNETVTRMILEAQDEEALDAFIQAQTAWLSELDRMTAQRLQAAAGQQEREAISKDRALFGQWLTARRTLLAFLYPDQPAAAAEQIADAIQARVKLLCQVMGE